MGGAGAEGGEALELVLRGLRAAERRGAGRRAQARRAERARALRPVILTRRLRPPSSRSASRAAGRSRASSPTAAIASASPSSVRQTRHDSACVSSAARRAMRSALRASSVPAVSARPASSSAARLVSPFAVPFGGSKARTRSPAWCAAICASSRSLPRKALRTHQLEAGEHLVSRQRRHEGPPPAPLRSASRRSAPGSSSELGQLLQSRSRRAASASPRARRRARPRSTRRLGRELRAGPVRERERRRGLRRSPAAARGQRRKRVVEARRVAAPARPRQSSPSDPALSTSASVYSPRMAEPARRPDAVEDPPPIDPRAVDRAYRFHRARRRARDERMRERGLARLRFWAVLLSLLVLTAYLSLIAWRQIEHLFGL